MPRGRGCVETSTSLEGEQCAYPARVGRALRSMLPIDVVVENRARSGVDIKVALHSLAGMFSDAELRQNEPDIILADFTANDILQREDKAEIGSMFEEFFVRTRNFAPRAALLVVLAPVFLQSAAFDDFAAQIIAACVFHQVAVLDLRMAARRTAWQPWGPRLSRPVVQKLMNEFQWSEESTEIALRSVHPPWVVHAAMSDMVVDSLLRLAGLSGCIVGQLAAPQQLFDGAQQSCSSPTTALSAEVHGNKVGASSPSGSWKLTVDEKGRAGWTTDVVGANLTFPIRFGSKAPLVLSVIYLRSYASVGAANLYCGTWQRHPARLEGRWNRQHSTPFVESFRADLTDSEHEVDGGMFGFNAKPDSTMNLTINFVGPPGAMFRLLGIVSC